MKRVLLVLAVLIVVPVLAIGGALFKAFGGNRPLVDGVELPGGARLVKDGIVAAYVLPAGDSAVALIDCGNDPTGGRLIAELTRRGLGPDAVKAIFLTHAHGDHIAGCHLFPKADIMAFEGDVGLAAGTARAKGPLTQFMSTAPERRITVTRVLKDGEDVTVGPLTVKAYAAPGHTGGSAVYFSGGTLYFGDSANGASDGTLKPAPWLFSDDGAQNAASLEAVARRVKADGLTVQTMTFAHSGPFDGVSALEDFRGQ